MSRIAITTTTMRSPATLHTAHRRAGIFGMWTVTWLGDRTLTHSQATTAMTLAVHAGIPPADPRWPHLTGWAEELDLSLDEALARIAVPPVRPRQHFYSVDCWCTPTDQPGGRIAHHDVVEVEFEATVGDGIDADGYAHEDHRGGLVTL